MKSVISEKNIELNNVFSIRKKLLQEEIAKEIAKTNELVKQNNLGIIKKIVTTAHGIEKVNGQVLVDTEIMVEIDGVEKKTKILSDIFKYTQKNFRIYDAVYAKHEGDSSELMKTVDMMMKYIQEKNIKQITNLYTVYQENKEEPGRQLIDCYIGVSRNLL